MKIEKRFLPSLWQDKFQSPREKAKETTGILSLVNCQVLGLLNAIS